MSGAGGVVEGSGAAETNCCCVEVLAVVVVSVEIVSGRLRTVVWLTGVWFWRICFREHAVLVAGLPIVSICLSVR